MNYILFLKFIYTNLASRFFIKWTYKLSEINGIKKIIVTKWIGRNCFWNYIQFGDIILAMHLKMIVFWFKSIIPFHNNNSWILIAIQQYLHKVKLITSLKDVTFSFLVFCCELIFRLISAKQLNTIENIVHFHQFLRCNLIEILCLISSFITFSMKFKPMKEIRMLIKWRQSWNMKYKIWFKERKKK